MMIPVPVLIAVLVFVLGCVLVDLRSRRIPNALSVAGMAVGLAMSAFYDGFSGMRTSVVAALAMIALLLAPFAVGGIGAGDVKMMAAVGSLLGPRLAFAALLVGMIFGGIVMIGHLARVGRLREKLASTGRMLMLAAGARSIEPLRVSAAQPAAVALPYSVPLGLGTAVVSIAALVTSGKPI
jgi:prepilin peptidase CpaA